MGKKKLDKKHLEKKTRSSGAAKWTEQLNITLTLYMALWIERAKIRHAILGPLARILRGCICRRSTYGDSSRDMLRSPWGRHEMEAHPQPLPPKKNKS